MILKIFIVVIFSIQTDKLQSNRDTVFFRDGVRRIDFVLSYVDDKDERKQVSADKQEVVFFMIIQHLWSPASDAVLTQFEELL